MMTTDPSDDALMRRAGNGDRVAFADLVERHLPRAGAIAGRMVASRADADDIVQEAFLRCWQKAPTWRPVDSAAATAQFTTWLHRIVVNLCIDRKRRGSPVPLDHAPDVAADGPDALETLARAETSQHMAAAVARLPARQRAALVLCYYEDMTNIEAAAVLELSVGAIESLLVRARRTLRKTLRPREEGSI
jgi:RNA polymerase sigma-70 factor (ECF subfamily)